jgi:hypothetical protein
MKFSIMKFSPFPCYLVPLHENPSSVSWVFSRWRTEMTKLKSLFAVLRTPLQTHKTVNHKIPPCGKVTRNIRQNQHIESTFNIPALRSYKNAGTRKQYKNHLNETTYTGWSKFSVQLMIIVKNTQKYFKQFQSLIMIT